MGLRAVRGGAGRPSERVAGFPGCGGGSTMDELIMRALEGESVADVVTGALLAGDRVELDELLARIWQETGRTEASERNRRAA